MNLSWNDNNWPFTILVRGSNFKLPGYASTNGIYVVHASRFYSATLMTI